MIVSNTGLPIFYFKFSDSEAILTGFHAVFWIRTGSGINEVSESRSEFGIRIQEGKNDPQNGKKIKNFHVFQVLDVLFEG
jgi:hypothetical protein